MYRTFEVCYVKDLMEDLDLLSLTIGNNIILNDNVIVFITVNFFKICKQTVDIHKEKVARRGIGTLASSKPTGHRLKIMAPPEQEKAARYSRRAIDPSALDHLGILFLFYN